MSPLVAIIRELIGLFVDDGALALAIVAVVIVAGLVTLLAPAAAWASGGVLLLGCLAVLLINVMTAKRR
jgi:hypothetical protein